MQKYGFKYIQNYIDEIEEELVVFFNEVLDYAKNNDFKIVVLILRKCYFIYKVLLEREKIKQESGIKVIPDSTFLGIIKYKALTNKESIYMGQKILVIDDTINTGSTINKFIECLIENIKLFPEFKEKKNKEIIQNYFGENNLKIGAYAINESKQTIRKFKETLFIKWGGVYVCDKLMFNREGTDEEFHGRIFRLVDYTASIGEIIDWDHLSIKATIAKPIDYHKLWKILENICEKLPRARLYKSNIMFFHTKKVKIGIYGINCLAFINDLKPLIMLDKFQCKIRFIFTMDDKLERINKVKIIPIVNPDIIQVKLRNREFCSQVIRIQLCSALNIPDAVINPENFDDLCRDCLLFEIITRITKTFIQEYFLMEKQLIEHQISNFDCKWELFSSIYNGSEAIESFCKKLCKKTRL